VVEIKVCREKMSERNKIGILSARGYLSGIAIEEEIKLRRNQASREFVGMM